MINAVFVRESKPRAKMYEVTCDGLPGFILRVLPTGKKVALVRYRAAGQEHRERIGLLGPTLTIDEARRRAAIMLAGESGDETSSQPLKRTGARVEQPEQARSQIVTLRSLAERFVRVHVDARLKPGTAGRYRQLLRDVILPYRAREGVPPLGDRDFRSIKKSEINELHASMSRTPGAANNMLATGSDLRGRQPGCRDSCGRFNGTDDAGVGWPVGGRRARVLAAREQQQRKEDGGDVRVGKSHGRYAFSVDRCNASIRVEHPRLDIDRPRRASIHHRSHSRMSDPCQSTPGLRLSGCRLWDPRGLTRRATSRHRARTPRMLRTGRCFPPGRHLRTSLSRVRPYAATVSPGSRWPPRCGHIDSRGPHIYMSRWTV